MSTEPGKIRNVAVTGHRGTGKTSLVEAMLFQSGAINRLGTVEQGTTTSDWDEDELRRLVFVNMLDRERADFYRALDHFRSQLSERCVAIHLPIGSEHELTGIVDLLHMTAYTSPDGEREAEAGEIPAE